MKYHDPEQATSGPPDEKVCQLQMVEPTQVRINGFGVNFRHNLGRCQWMLLHLDESQRNPACFFFCFFGKTTFLKK